MTTPLDPVVPVLLFLTPDVFEAFLILVSYYSFGIISSWFKW